MDAKSKKRPPRLLHFWRVLTWSTCHRGGTFDRNVTCQWLAVNMSTSGKWSNRDATAAFLSAEEGRDEPTSSEYLSGGGPITEGFIREIHRRLVKGIVEEEAPVPTDPGKRYVFNDG